MYVWMVDNHKIWAQFEVPFKYIFSVFEFCYGTVADNPPEFRWLTSPNGIEFFSVAIALEWMTKHSPE